MLKWTASTLQKGGHLKKANEPPIQWHSLCRFTSAQGQLSALQAQQLLHQYLEVNQTHGCWLMWPKHQWVHDIEKQKATLSGKPITLGLVGWGLRVRISNKLWGDANSAGPWTTLYIAKVWTRYMETKLSSLLVSGIWTRSQERLTTRWMPSSADRLMHPSPTTSPQWWWHPWQFTLYPGRASHGCCQNAAPGTLLF